MIWVLIAETWVFVKSLPRRRDTLFWLIVFPVVYMLLVNTLFAPREAVVSFDVAVLDLDGSSLSRSLLEAMNSSGVLKPVVVSDVSPVELLRGKGYPLVLVIPEGFHHNITNVRQARLEVYYDPISRDSLTTLEVMEGFILRFNTIISNMTARIMLNYMPEPFKSTISGYIIFMVNPVTLSKFNVTTPTVAVATKAFKLSLVTLTTGIMLLYTGLLGGLYAIVEKRYEGYVQSILSSNIRPSAFMLSEIIAVIAGGLISATVIALTGLILGAPILEVPLHKILVALTLLLVSILGLTGLGLTLGILAKRPESASALGNAIAFPTMFIGGFIIPKFMLPTWLQWFPEVFPHTRLVYAITYYMLGEWSLEKTLVYSIPAITLSLTLLLLGAITYRRVLEKLHEG